MIIDADISLTVKITGMYLNDTLSDEEKREIIIKEGEKRLRHYLSGYLLDPDKKIILKNLEIYATK